jgi:hypothetical protein
MSEQAKAIRGKPKPPIPKYRYKFVTVIGSHQASRVEDQLRERLNGLGLSFFSICHENGHCDVMGDSGTTPLAHDDLRDARGVAAAIQEA